MKLKLYDLAYLAVAAVAVVSIAFVQAVGDLYLAVVFGIVMWALLAAMTYVYFLVKYTTWLRNLLAELCKIERLDENKKGEQ
jgi:hypothetical protein